ncbi:MAG: polysaccharide pyruvyl transferase family protein [Acidobacteria bacterium]|nr:polysaccharide pyruvyl transferase family protein [Acidobacteriota bacterium]
MDLAVALFNDTGSSPHVGCLAVSEAHRLMLARAGGFVRHAFFQPDWHGFAKPTLDESVEAAWASAPLRRVLASSDAVVVNGEGTIHHGNGRHLLAILAAAQRAGLPTFLVNAVLQDADDGRGILAALTDCTVRDAASARYLDGLGVAHRTVSDSFFEAPFLGEPIHDFTGRVVVTDCHPALAGALAPAFDAVKRALGTRRTAHYLLESSARAADWRHALADLRGADAIVTGRHHGVCLALRAGIPFVAVPSNSWKIEGFLERLPGCPHSVMDLSIPLLERLEAARAARAWFAIAAARLAAECPLPTFDRLRSAPPSVRIDSTEPVVLDEATMSAVRGVVRPDAPVLHAGSADGSFVAALLSTGVDARGVEAAAHLVARCHAAIPGRFHRGMPDALPFGDRAFGTIVVSSGWLDHLEDGELDAAFGEIRRVSCGAIVIEAARSPARALRARGRGRDRGWWEERAFAAGLRRHPRAGALPQFDERPGDSRPLCLLLEAADRPATGAVRDIRLAPCGEAGAHLAAYEWARRYVKPGDVVAHCSRFDGVTSLLLEGTEAARVEMLVRGGDHRRVAEASIDCLVVLDDPAAVRAIGLEAIGRMLRPGGRLLCALPGDAAAADLAGELPPALLVDEVARAGGTHLVSVLKDPLAPGTPAYVERVFPSQTDTPPNAVAFARDYERPWCVHAIATPAFRARSPHLLRTLARRWLAAATPGSADAGAALCVLAYRELEAPAGDLEALLARTAAYCARPAVNPLARRWQISLRFASGLLHLRRGSLAAAEHVLRDCSRQDAVVVTPHLATKTTEAAWLAGRLAWGRGDRLQAEASFRRALAILDDLKRAPVADWIVNDHRPNAFECGDGLREIAVAIDTAALCANALRRLADPVGRWRPGSRPVEQNFQRNADVLLDLVARRGGEIDALRHALQETHDDWRTSCEALQDLRRRVGPIVPAPGPQPHGAGFAHAGPAAISRMRRRAMKRVAIFGCGPAGRRLWEALAGCGTVDIAGWIADGSRTSGRSVLGAPLHDPSWLATGRVDVLAVADADAAAARRALARAGCGTVPMMVFPTDDAELDRFVGGSFPDPLDGDLALAGDPDALAIGIFGTGEAGMKVWEALADIDAADAVWFADNDPARQGARVLWLDVIAPGEILARRFDAVVIGSMSRTPIERQLRQLGVPPPRILAPDVQLAVGSIRRQLAASIAGLACGEVVA